MADQFVGEIRIFPFNFAPTGWALCNGQLLPISQNTALFSLLGTQYGGNGTSNFALPNLEGSIPIHQHQGNGLTDRIVGETGGEPGVTLLISEMPIHSHPPACNTSAADQTSPTGHVWGIGHSGRQTVNLYASAKDSLLNSNALTPVGASQPHNNMPPYLALNFCIALQGIFPPRS